MASQHVLIDVLVQQNDELVDYISYRFGDRQFAKEVVQETCLRVLQAPSRIDEIQSPIALLKKMSLCVAVDHYRKEKSLNVKLMQPILLVNDE